MDKYEFNIKVEQIKKLVNKGDFEMAMKIADTIDWRRVRNANLLSMISTVYEKNAEYQEAKDILLIAFERAPIGKRLLYKLTQLALKQKDIQEAETYYREFCELSGDDSRQDVLRYLILKAKGAPLEQLIHSLESYTSSELDEKWLYELAELYHQAGMENECVKTCDKIMLMFGLGQYVDKAMELKLQYAPLTKYQMDLVENRDKYEAKLKQIEENGVNALNPSQEEYEDGGKLLSKTEEERAAARREQLVTMETNYEEANRKVPQWDSAELPIQNYQQENQVIQPQSYAQGNAAVQPQVYAQGNSAVQPQAYAQENAAVQPQAYAQKNAAVQPQAYAQKNAAVQPQAYAQENAAVQPRTYVQEYAAVQPQNYVQENAVVQPQNDMQNFTRPYGEPKPIPVPVPAPKAASGQQSALYLEKQENVKPDNQASLAAADKPENEVSAKEKLAVSMKEAEVEASLAEEMSKISIDNYTEEPVREKTRILQTVKDLKNKEEVAEKTKILDEIRHIQPVKSIEENAEKGDEQLNPPQKADNPQKEVSSPKSPVFYHIMLENRSPEKGLETAVEVLKKAHQILEIRHPVAKISGERLNQKGILSSASMLAGKDLIIENAGDLSDAMLEELNQLLEKDNSQMIVILVDNARQIKGLSKVIPSLTEKFFFASSAEEAQNYIGSTAEKEKAHTAYARSQTSRSAEKIVQRPVRAVQARRETAIAETAPVHQGAKTLASTDETLQTRHQADFSAGAEMIRQKMNSSSARQAAVSSISSQKISARLDEKKKEKTVVLSMNSKKEIEENPVMDLDEFAQYCCHYAAQIDCNISGKSMLALYERIEIMEEDGIKLTRKAAEDLIEEAADRAEKPSIGKRLTGLFSSKYDKEGLLILKEEHFI